MKKEKEYTLKTFVCPGCKQKYCDTKLYFYDIKSEKCIWCTKYPKKKSNSHVKTS